MFERYTEKARRVIFFARREASLFGSPCIESEHLLLGLLEENKALLHAPGTLESIRKQIEARTPLRVKVPTSDNFPASDECKRILAYAAEEANNLSHKHIGTEHLVLGVLREQDCFAAALLRERGFTLEVYREQIRNILSGQLGTGPTFATSSRPLPPKSPGLPTGYRSQRVLYNNAAETLILELQTSPIFLSQEQLAYAIPESSICATQGQRGL